MAKSRQQKEEMVADLTDKMSRSKAVVFAQVSGYTMAEANSLREVAEKEGLEVAMVKKTLVERAAKEAGIELFRDSIPGSTLALFSYDDEISPARVITNFAKNRESITVTAGILEGNLVGMETVTAFASLPSREELLAKLVGSINAPVSGFVNVLAANLRGLVQVLGAIKEQKA